ncbi:MAG: hotdog fold thioesterase [Saprospiraceae bacterium]|jgi:acyl-CoA thioesterase|nr:hotdog fold thioesterase [Saprospiraceae bacterium]
MDSLAYSVFQKMYSKDGFSEWLGISCVLAEESHCILKMSIRPEMLNGFGIAHGGIVYSLCDSAFAFCCNSHNRISVSIETNISHTKPIHQGDNITAEAKMVSQSNKIGNYEVIARNQSDEIVAIFKGVCYRTSQTHFDFGSPHSPK